MMIKIIIGIVALLLAASSHANSGDDSEKTFQEYHRLAMKGSGHAQFTLGEMYELGRHVQEDKKEAVHWYRQAADQGHRVAKIRLINLEKGWLTRKLENMNKMVLFFLIAFVLMAINEIFGEKPSSAKDNSDDDDEYDPSDFNSPYYDHGSDPLGMHGDLTNHRD